MKKVIIPVMALAIGFASCDKVDTKPTTTTTTPTTTTPTAPTPVTPATPSGYWGALAAVKMKFSYSNPQLPMEIPAIESQIGTAVFYDNKSGGTANMVDAGAVSVNSNNLPKQSNNSYLVNATVGQTPSTLDLGTNVNWKVAGGNGIPAITYNHSGTFPDYSGKLPTSIDKSKDLVINLGSDIAGADSVYIVIATSGKTIMKSVVGKPAPATVTIKASELSGLPTVTDNTAYLEVVPFTYAYPSISGKGFVFIKETAVVSAVSIQ